MSRVKRGFKARRRRKKVLGLAKGFRGSRSTRFKTAAHVVKRSLAFAYRDRRVRRREVRKLWIVRINAAARAEGIRYGDFMNGLKKANIEIDRSVLADLCLSNEAAFKELIGQAKAALAA